MSHVYRHLEYSEGCSEKCGEHCSKILDSAPVGLDLKTKEALHIKWLKSTLNQQIRQFNIKLSL